MSLTWFYHVSQQVSTHVHGQGIVPIEDKSVIRRAIQQSQSAISYSHMLFDILYKAFPMKISTYDRSVPNAFRPLRAAVAADAA